MSSLLNWLLALLEHWQGWMSGGGIGGLLLIVLYLFERFHPSGWTLSKRWYAAIIIVFFVFGASYYTWRDQQSVIEHIRAQIGDLEKVIATQTQSQFTIQPLQAVVGSLPVGGQITFVLRLENVGAASAIPEDSWILSATTEDGKNHLADMIMLSPVGTDLCLNHDGVLLGAKRFVPADGLYEKASHPISSGDYRIGVIGGSFRDLTKVALLSNSTRFHLRAEDVRHKEFGSDISMSDISKNNGRMIFLPSLSNPYNIATPTCPMSASK